MKDGKTSKDLMRRIIANVSSILKKEPNMIEIESDCAIIGDIHG